MKKKFMAIVAVIIAISASAFTVIKKTSSDLVWFEVNGNSGSALNGVSGGVQGDEPPINCPNGSKFCSTALSISDGEVIDNGDGTYGIASGVDITSSAYFDQRRMKN